MGTQKEIFLSILQGLNFRPDGESFHGLDKHGRSIKLLPRFQGNRLVSVSVDRPLMHRLLYAQHLKNLFCCFASRHLDRTINGLYFVFLETELAILGDFPRHVVIPYDPRKELFWLALDTITHPHRLGLLLDYLEDNKYEWLP